jgi:hypothetical protein
VKGVIAMQSDVGTTPDGGSGATDTRTVSSAAELERAIHDLSAGKGGTVLLEAGGGPYTLRLDTLGRSDAPVTITAADPGDPPVIATLELRNVSGLVFDGLSFRTGDIDGYDDIRVFYSQDVAFTNNTMQGTAEGFAYTGGPVPLADSLMIIRDSARIDVSDNLISGYFHGIGYLDNTDLTVSGNEFTRLQGDGLRGGGIDGAVISGNYMHSFFGTSQDINHTDMIQFWGTYTKSPNRDIMIADNILLAGDGMAVQGILVRNETIFGDLASSGYFQNITIRDNLVHTGVVNGIIAADTMGLSVTDNTVLWSPDARSYSAPGVGGTAEARLRVFNAPDAVVTGNIAGNIETDIPGLLPAADNLLVNYYDPDSPFHVDRHIVDHAHADLLDARALALRADSPFAGLYGAQPDLPWLDDAAPILRTEIAVRDGHMLAADMQVTAYTAGGAVVDPGLLTVRWRLEDGTVLDGDSATWVFARHGAQDVVAEVVDPLGRTISAVQTIQLDNPTMLTLDFDTGVVDMSGQGVTLNVRDPGMSALVAGRDDGGFHLQPTTGISVWRDVFQFVDLDRFEIALDMKGDPGNAAGAVLDMFGIFLLSLGADGTLAFDLQTDAGRYRVESGPAGLGDAGWHALKLRYDDSAGRLDMVLDGTVVDSVAATGRTPDVLRHMDVGGSWKLNADVVIDNLKVSQPPSAAALEGLRDTGLGLDTDGLVARDYDAFLFAFDFDDGLVDVSGNDTGARLIGADALTDQGRTGGGLVLSPDTRMELDRGQAHVVGLDAFDIMFDLRLTDPAAGGLLNLHTVMDLDLLSDGRLRFWMETDAGRFGLVTDSGALADTDWHRLQISYSDVQDRLALSLDGDVLAETHATGTTRTVFTWGLGLGETWGVSASAVIDDFGMSVPAQQDWML